MTSTEPPIAFEMVHSRFAASPISGSGGDSTFERQDYGLRFAAGSSKSIETATGFKGAYLLWYLNKH